MTRLVALASFAAAFLAATLASASDVSTVTAGGRSYRVYAPTTPRSPAPAVVLLHGCTQTNDAFAEATAFDAVAEAEGVYAIYPDEPTSLSPNKCFVWWEPANQRRDSGEPAALADAIGSIVKARGIDPERVYVAGISAGAAMALTLAVTYPDRFAAAGTVAGVPYGSASSVSEGVSVTMSGARDPSTLGATAKSAMGSLARPVPVLVVQGDADGVVNPVNGEQVTGQFRDLAELALGPGSVGAGVVTTGHDGYAYARTAYPVANGASVVEYLAVNGLGHAWPGGEDGGSYSDAKGPSASRALWTFFAPRTVSTPLPESAVPEPLPGDGEAPDAAAASSSSSSGGHGGAAPSPGASSGCGTTRTGRGSQSPFALAAMVGLLLLRRRRARTLDRARSIA